MGFNSGFKCLSLGIEWTHIFRICSIRNEVWRHNSNFNCGWLRSL